MTVDIDLKAGEISPHSDMLLHGSEPNGSMRRRCGLTIRYVVTKVVATRCYAVASILCHGADPQGNWSNVPRPHDEDPVRRALQTQAVNA